MAVAAQDRRLNNRSFVSLFGGHGAIARAGAARGVVPERHPSLGGAVLTPKASSYAGLSESQAVERDLSA